jgi:Arylsulfatase regulator (Fe-S oxidoreductase)
MSYIDLTILTTKQCQFGCIYCFEGGKSKESISSQTMDDIIHFISYHSHTCRRLRVTWFGGEPLLGYKQMQNLSERLITYCDKVGITYSADITTNGFALSPHRCQELVKKCVFVDSL